MLNADTPLRVTWNTVGSETSEGRLSEIARRIATAQPLEVTVRVDRGTLEELVAPEAPDGHGKRSSSIISQLASTGSLEVVFDSAGAEGAARLEGLRGGLSALASTPSDRLMITIDYTDTLGSGPDFAELSIVGRILPGVGAGVSVCPDAANLGQTLRLIREAARRGVPRIRLAHPDLTGREGLWSRETLLTARHIETLAQRHPEIATVAAEVEAAGCHLVVHDLFLSRALFGKVSASYHGCQAGATMAHVDCRGDVYPCSACPVSLGSLLDRDLAEIWAQKERAALRSLIETPGPLCVDCEDYSDCRGGCRCLSFLVNGAWNRPDPGCPRGAGVQTQSGKRQVNL